MITARYFNRHLFGDQMPLQSAPETPLMPAPAIIACSRRSWRYHAGRFARLPPALIFAITQHRSGWR